MLSTSHNLSINIFPFYRLNKKVIFKLLNLRIMGLFQSFLILMAILWIPFSTQLCEQHIGGSYFHCVLLQSKNIKCVGFNGSGQLGLGDNSDRGDQPNEVGDYLPFVDIGSQALAVHVGTGYSCAHLVTLEVKCWGNGGGGQLGQESAFNIGDGPFELGVYLDPINLGSPNSLILFIGNGISSTCLATLDGDMKCFGSNGDGQLGYEDTSTRGDSANSMGNYLPFVDLGPNQKVKYLSSGYRHFCSLLANDKIKCWGDNANGFLGYGDIEERGDETNEMGVSLPYVALGTGLTPFKIKGFWQHNLVLFTNGDLKGFGHGSNARLAGTSHLGDDPNEMGDYLPTINLGTGRTAVDMSTGAFHSVSFSFNFDLIFFL